jgi:hypothetical protein
LYVFQFYKYRKHTIKQTLAKYPEIKNRKMISNWCKTEAKIRECCRLGQGQRQIIRTFHKYVFPTDLSNQTLTFRYSELDKALVNFFVLVREVHGAVNRSLLEAYAMTLGDAITQGFTDIGEKRKDRFFRRWRRDNKVVDRRVSGMIVLRKMCTPSYFRRSTASACRISVKSGNIWGATVFTDETVQRPPLHRRG